MRTIIVILLILSGTSAFAFDIDTIRVGRCDMEVMVMSTPTEHASGMLGFTERSFPYGGMLFKMGKRGRKIFHTMGMSMNIRIMGVNQTSNGSYNVLTDVYNGKPNIKQIPIDAPDILEIPESKYQMYYKRCLQAKEAM
ncbi:MAG: hypothetical protein LBV09_01755 [Deferribacteraceae bacterium]|jgi:hypothetical protein|nr:hypothetical protein [Deferribacteraceae bacterium]